MKNFFIATVLMVLGARKFGWLLMGWVRSNEIVFIFVSFIQLFLPVLLIVVAIIVFRKPWNLIKKITFLLSLLAIFSVLPIYSYNDGCTYSYSLSYLNPIGYGNQTPDSSAMCLQVISRGIFYGHFLLTDLALVSWVVYFLVKGQKNHPVEQG